MSTCNVNTIKTCIVGVNASESDLTLQVARLRARGALVLAKTALSEWAQQSANSICSSESPSHIALQITSQASSHKCKHFRSVSRWV